jgi:hypothetical protein
MPLANREDRTTVASGRGSADSVLFGAMDPVAGTAEHRGPVEVRARAPGKIILTGEHAVVHGSAAVAAAIDLYTNSSLLLRPAGPGAPAKHGFF